MLAQQTQILLDVLHDPASDERAIQGAADSWVQTLQNPDSIQAILEAQTQLAGVLDWENLARAQFALMMSGALVENGFSPEPLLKAFAPRLPLWLRGAGELLDAVIHAEGDGQNVEARTAEVTAQMPAQARDWERLQAFYLPLMAALSASPEARAQLRPLRELAAPLSERHEGAFFLDAMLGVLDKEPILVLEPARQRGFVGTFSGIADNAQLHALLMAHYPDAARKFPAKALPIFDGSGEQTSEISVESNWNLYAYGALDRDGHIKDDLADSQYWLWNEDSPIEIPTFENYRVIILGPSSYTRGWAAQRLFAPLRASIDVDEELDKGGVAAWIERLGN